MADKHATTNRNPRQRAHTRTATKIGLKPAGQRIPPPRSCCICGGTDELKDVPGARIMCRPCREILAYA